MKVIIKQRPDCIEWVTFDTLILTYRNVGEDWIVWIKKLMFEGVAIKITNFYTHLKYKVHSMTYIDDTILKFTIKRFDDEYKT
jgi:hypothetical protein